MLGKLLKHEMKAYLLPMGIIFLAGTLMILFLKILSLIPYKNNVRDFIQIGLVFGFAIMAFLISTAVTVIVVVRFYSTTVSDQAYLTWTLPAKTSTILWSKIIGGLLWRIITVLVIIALGVLFFVGSYWMWHEDISGALFGGGDISIGMVLNETIKQLGKEINSKELAGLMLYYLSTFVWSIASILLIFMCIAIGQLFGKYRVLASIGCYFIIMIIVQIISTVGMVVISGISAKINSSDNMLAGKFGFTQGIISMTAALITCAVLFVVTNILFEKHLNLD